MQIIATAPNGKSYPVKVKANTTQAQAEKLAETLMSVGATTVVILP
jgi:hypothetical protein